MDALATEFRAHGFSSRSDERAVPPARCQCMDLNDVKAEYVRSGHIDLPICARFPEYVNNVR